MKGWVGLSGVGESGGQPRPPQRTDMAEVSTSHRQGDGGSAGMSKSIMVGLLVASLLAGAVPALAQAQVQGGIGDPLTLAASGVVIPFYTAGGLVSTIQVASPVADNPNAHMFFFDSSCAKLDLSVGIPLTTNDIAFQQIGSNEGGPVTSGTNGLVTLAKADQTGFRLDPLENPVHVRMYVFRPGTGESRVIEPIIVNTAEFPSVAHWWSPLRSGATFYAPCQECPPPVNTQNIFTDLFLICPEDSIQGGPSAVFGSDPGGGNPDFVFTNPNANSSGGFPQINPRFPAASGGTQTRAIRVRIYDTNEVFKRDFTIDCDCVINYPKIADSILPFYGDPVEAALGTYTELTSAPISNGRRTTFTGYTDTYNGLNATNHFFGRLQNGSQASIDGPAVSSTR